MKPASKRAAEPLIQSERRVATIRALAPKQAEQPTSERNIERMIAAEERVLAEQPDHEFVPGPYYEAERGDGETVTNRICRVCKRSERAPVHRQGGERG